MTVLEKIKRCVSLVWDFQEFYGDEDIEDFCRNELHTYPQHNEIVEYFKHIENLEKENAELRKVAEFQQSSNMNRHFENKKLKEGLAVGSTFNKALNSMNKNLEEERDKYRNMVFDLQKENAELKTKVTALENANRAMVKELDDTTSGGLNILQNVVKNKEELTNAKEIIKKLKALYLSHVVTKDDVKRQDEILAEAEQFLKDCEVEK